MLWGDAWAYTTWGIGPGAGPPAPFFAAFVTFLVAFETGFRAMPTPRLSSHRPAGLILPHPPASALGTGHDRLVAIHLVWAAPVVLAIVVMAVQGRVAAPATLAAAVTLPPLFLSKQDRFRLLGLERPDLDARRGPAFTGAAIVVAVVGTLGGLFTAASALVFGVQPHLLVAAVIALVIAGLGPVAVLCSLKSDSDTRGRRWMAGYCFAVLGSVAIGYLGVYLNDVFGPF
jgi:hypothetical protein